MRFAKKESLRGELLETRRELSFEDVYALSLKVQQRLIDSHFFRDSAKLALYYSFGNEVLTDEVFRAAIGSGKEVYYPRVAAGNGRALKFFRVRSLDEMEPGAYEVREPLDGTAAVGAEAFDLIVVPGVAFDERGGRIGFGKGYYDAALGSAKCSIVALAYEFQVLKTKIPLEPHDVTVSAIVTEKRVVLTGAHEGTQRGGSGV
ncbi:MAG TPA: 5-formyltetrahydrofolate cyclo-ligase [Deltaproteobacteria bacterium]|nr:MAG: 5-formyltetrahydrofolate cyclo-ligase [Deltaproteobacteria bacterium GWA2_55_82]OGQ63088.1 MAG: 5-formyltetrahydrofolate cyclo-ligase [Deltaproteobacteria bacterium RIFCSPLOWO2_02_FULL_55_12]OIJ73547.1 MAG: 5-formyltetrahydrofolate cyclo-ligase [Deltaproteobacteria bacterium GWC2_55_46]HBG47680.1 5-formyltetrahydrofolate cyclo-ligase [Deltaproteobacteria bacterium]HCY12098.1 5-formyltetrahydrofolate cyclo-ligase [Deltaproteobacteria bacterium]